MTYVIFLFTTIIVCIVFLGCAPPTDVNYEKGYPFWDHHWEYGELMATYLGSDGEFSWEYRKYFNIPDTVVDERGSKFHDLRVATYRFNGSKISGHFYDHSQVYVNERLVSFPAIAREK